MESIVSQTAQFLSAILPIIAIIAITINVCHVAILTRSSVTSSSMNILLIGIAIVDILSPMSYVKQGISRLITIGSHEYCYTASYTSILIDLILDGMSECFRRCSTWLGLVLVANRSISLKLAAKRRCPFITEPKFGLKLIFCTLFCSFLISISYFFRYRIVKEDPHFCQTTSGDHVLVEKLKISELISQNWRRAHILLTGIFGQLIPSILFPIFAVILICGLRKPNSKASRLSVRAERSAKIVIYMTISFLLIELPIGVGKIVNAMQTESIVPHEFNQIFVFLYVPMTISHCLICCSVSTQYRTTILKVLGLERKFSPRRKKISSVIIQPTIIIFQNK